MIASVLGARRSLAGNGPPEVTTIRLAKIPGIRYCGIGTARSCFPRG
jgi:hypothetical protein